MPPFNPVVEQTGRTDYPNEVRHWLLIPWVAALSLASMSGGVGAPAPPPGLFPEDWLISRDGRRLVDSQQQPVRLRNHPRAINVPLQKVVDFIRTNQANTLPYRADRFKCTEYALRVHDDAEATGIRCALVALRFYKGEGHALNAFQTTDKGLVYVDCTGVPNPVPNRSLYDTIGYLRIGRPYGRLPLEIGAFDPVRYERYTYVMALWNQAFIDQYKLNQNRRDLVAKQAEFRNQSSQLRQEVRQDPDRLNDPKSEERIAELLDLEKELNEQHQDISERRESLADRFRRLRVRYDMNTSPVKSVDIWW